MAFCRIVLPLLVLSVVNSLASTSVPVFFWGDIDGPTIKSNPLVEVSELEFKNILEDKLKDDQFTVIFADETLSIEDLSRKNSQGESAFPYLHSNIGDVLYLPSVENPIKVLKKLEDSNKVDHVKLTENGLSAEIEKDDGKILFITLKDAREGESRSDLLRRHNDFMEDMVSKLQEHYSKVVAIYTAEFPSWTVPDTHSRVRRQVQSAAYQTFNLNGLRMFTKNIILSSQAGVVYFSAPTNTETVMNGTLLNATLSFGDKSITLNFEEKSGYWFFDTVVYTESTTTPTTEFLYGKSEVYALSGFSYRCGQNATFTSNNSTTQYTLTFQDLKVQPYFKDTNSTEPPKFGDSYNCVGFFSVPIWSCLFVTFILLAITFYGIMMMMDIRTMDRFDDPKGKTITINAGE
ncbi:unnamed protein product [Leptidea sinapis]|uniref:Vacuolar H+ ATPase AC45 accessory subunit n=1 Tax=Leptidea sinapis TaxID=189913 RepID=A0A5E4QT24_9NEOP|nr:unnamed protein product [Leptidea sinapis]